MSRVGKRMIEIPTGVTIEVKQNNEAILKGPRGVLQKTFSPLISIIVKDNIITTERSNEEKHTKQLHGTTNSLLQGMVTGVSVGFEKNLLIKGVGYKAILKGSEIEIFAGYSHTVLLPIPSTIKVEVPKPTEIKISGNDKQEVGEFAAKIRKIRKPNIYSGKGIMYSDETILLKEGKASSK
ncbi:MAG: 50S ribosomal protein L6 [Metamycoplasmataceae bacterium]